jgi:hypothetical protein
LDSLVAALELKETKSVIDKPQEILEQTVKQQQPPEFEMK